jgi:hydrogenase maturation protease
MDDLLAEQAPALSVHQLGLFDTLLMARQVGCPPHEVVIFGVQPKSLACTLDLSDEIAAIVPKVVDLVLAEATK